MLLQINIKNFALIEDLTISFDNGFNVLTGETGAGKSILIDAINYVLGGKFSRDLIRTGEEKTYVEAIFTIENDKTKNLLKELEVDFDDLLIISRETFHSGKSIAKINGKSLILSNIKTISSTLLDIHGQHENQNLLDSGNHIIYLDLFGEKSLQDELKDYNNMYKEFLRIEHELEKIQGKEGEKEKVIDFYKYQLEEINKANLKKEEDKELESQYSILSNAEKINKILSSSFEMLSSGSDNYISVIESLGIIIKDLRSIERHVEKIKNLADGLEEAFYNIEESSEDIRKLRDNIQYDEEKLEIINSRIYQIGLLKKKYGNSIEDILEYRNKIEKDYNELVNSSEIIEKLKFAKNKLLNQLKDKVKKVHNIRGNISVKLEKAVMEELKYIGLEKSTFKIEVAETGSFNEYGSDKVQFLISTNPGEPIKPLEKVVSGGELSRIMLALKSVFVDKDMIPSVIFDEIDVGISGRIAQSVAEKMYSISNRHQVFCVTHLPQIACMSDSHFLISKQVKNEKTFTFVHKMNVEEKQSEIARMIGGSEVTKLTLDHSKELIFMAEQKKNNLKSKI
ncbi:DNA repair protein RecN [Clostridium sp. YIM B02515]|uniref:DNA repair protein RecN n=1 Tax=Clostridium rhizosphaerae TaxID=2803861 RepID=A0ABS1TEU9_9CLOT|nr:DNA repair protein RecN [Clostridium rhizosphaerae]MBL4937899.1 DNA repair protein RecN [Clostridium rhizosphaerae]